MAKTARGQGPSDAGCVLRDHITVRLEALVDALPDYTAKDFAIFQRQNAHGVWKSEVWTKRDFDPREILLAPCSSQLKETHIMSSANCPVALPAHGPGKHPEARAMPFDGRTRTSIATNDLLDSTEHTGSLFWLVNRTSGAALANLALEETTCELY